MTHFNTLDAIEEGAALGILSAADKVMATTQFVERQTRGIAAVRELHKPEELDVTCSEDCEEHEDDHPIVAKLTVCNHCYGLAIEVDDYYGENGIAREFLHPCQTVRALDEAGA
ncbi:hypothetical protein [Mycolicibacterium brisbanense]|uniref:Uncharacterized protein n=1 Tax=Mycolicibacterium brisbanense TaxID=146020 RepID=A0A117I862_9MYCO|nr:hypothetical protein [Mycolicibacterium brisbanense]MCV7158011.1 hypothetical protein [Mycolicibacterium brisbanense]GAS92659.1 uncharacterized protein RMCB_6755 [Mycolicibacterium brisbanense]